MRIERPWERKMRIERRDCMLDCMIERRDCKLDCLSNSMLHPTLLCHATVLCDARVVDDGDEWE